MGADRDSLTLPLPAPPLGPPASERTPLGPAQRLLRWLAAPGWMLAFFLFALGGALAALYWPEAVTAIWALPLSVFALSLTAAVATNRRLRGDPLLLGLHLGLLVLVVLAAVARLTYLDGAVTLTQGMVFDGQLNLDRRGPLHGAGVERLRFANAGFSEDFAPGARWPTTSNRVRWWDASGRSHLAVVGDDTPLRLDGYRIYATRNRGYSPLFRWQPLQGPEEVGTVQLRAGSGFSLAHEWRLPAGREVWVLLEFEQSADLRRGEQRANLGAASLPHHLLLRLGDDSRHLLRLGESLDLPEGRLTYLALDSWMGYRIVYDMAMYWMAAAAVLVVACMMLYYGRLLRRPQGTL